MVKTVAPYVASRGRSVLLTVVRESIETERLMLLRPTLADLDDFFAIDGDPLTHLHNPAGPDTTIETSERRLRSYMDDWTTFGIGYWIVRLKPDSDIIGIAGLRSVELLDREVLNLYYRFKPVAWGNGFATEVARAALDVACKDFPGLPVVARTRPTNEPAMAVARKIGLERRLELEGEYVVFTSQW